MTERSLRKSPAALLALAAALGVAACGNGDGSTERDLGVSGPAGALAGDTGSFSFALTVPPGIVFDTFTYAITGPNYTKAASLDVSRSSTVSAIVGNLPVGTGYSVTLMGRSVQPVTTCTGSAAFAITAGQETTVPVDVACHVQNQAVAAVPVPGSSSAALGFVLLAIGVVAVRRGARSA
jgi:hypothetical protein